MHQQNFTDSISLRLMEKFIEPRMKMRLIGALVLVGAVGGNIYIWHSVIFNGIYWKKASFLFPFFICFGLSVLLYPVTKAECLTKHGSEHLPWKHIPIGQKTLLLLGLVLGVLQLAFFSGELPL